MISQNVHKSQAGIAHLVVMAFLALALPISLVAITQEVRNQSKAYTPESNGQCTTPDCQPVLQKPLLGQALALRDKAYVRLTTAIPELATKNFTIEAWIYPTEASGAIAMPILGELLSSENGAACRNGMQLYVRSSGDTYRLGFGMNTTQKGAAWAVNGDVNSTIPIPYGKWSHVAVSRNGDVVKTFVNGKVNAETNLRSPKAQSTCTIVSPLVIGGAVSDTAVFDTFKGYIDELRVSAVTAYTGEFEPPVTALNLNVTDKLLFHFESSLQNQANPTTPVQPEGNIVYVDSLTSDMVPDVVTPLR